ncbi:hypothetical protein [Halopelagius longus]|uniref:Class I SAM-dependent methyltransferase n=1 Tax=Halopelagius longus TaxID=1236180 RepID=A0A1H1BMJ1_9EURY|nr:hypothetical protein [Halopelagius longus]RDI70844.1 hypothetical protein DWB78_03385 [Halopelagius longus]SDQ53162.1 hypothetical protein SAMN05216278_1864 [Halopelagius longus]
MPPTLPETYSYTRFLRAQESIDDAALHRPTLDRFRAELDRLAERSANPLRIVDVGGGIGSMCRRLFQWDVLPENVTYVVLDADPETVRIGCETVREWVRDSNRAATWESENRLYLPDASTTVRFVADDAFRHLDARTYDVLIGHAFAGTIDLSNGLPALLDGIESGGVCYFPITFDGQTAFRPSGRADERRAILDAYHASMSFDGGSAQFGGALLDAVAAADAELLSAGGSDRVVSPPYDGEQKYFLHHLLHRVEQAVGDEVDDDAVRRWVGGKHRAVAEEELTYLAQNVDVLFRVD